MFFSSGHAQMKGGGAFCIARYSCPSAAGIDTRVIADLLELDHQPLNAQAYGTGDHGGWDGGRGLHKDGKGGSGTSRS